jgi:hypothetical protein
LQRAAEVSLAAKQFDLRLPFLFHCRPRNHGSPPARRQGCRRRPRSLPAPGGGSLLRAFNQCALEPLRTLTR